MIHIFGGDGYSNANHIWWQQFRQILKEKGYENIEVYGAGIYAYSTNDQFEYIIKDNNLIEKVDPDLIIFGFVYNDLEVRDKQLNLIDSFIIYEDIFFDIRGISKYKIKDWLPNLYAKVCISISEKYKNSVRFHDIFGFQFQEWIQKISSGKSIRQYEYGTIKPMKEYIEKELKIPFFFMYSSYYKEIGTGKIAKVFDNNDIDFYIMSDLVKKYNIPNISHTYMINPANNHPSVSHCKAQAETLFSIMNLYYSEFLGKPTGTYVPQFIINDWMPYSLKPERIAQNSYKFTYPATNTNNAFLRLPIEKEYVKLNLEDPLNISNISIEAENIEEIELYINNINEKLGYDDQEMTKLEKNEDGFSWKVDSNVKVTSINVAAKIKNGNMQEMIIKVK